MTRLIDANKLKKNMIFNCCGICDICALVKYEGGNRYCELIDNASTVKPKKGKWIFNKYNVWECSCCGGNPHTGTGFLPSIERMKKQWKFCNLCGAQMGVDDND